MNVKDENIKKSNVLLFQWCYLYRYYQYICYIGYVTIKKDLKIYSVNPLYLIFGKVNGFFEETNGNKYLSLDPTNENKKKIKKYEELWIKIRNLITSITKT